MTSSVELDIQASQDQLAALFADPNNSPRWMDDLDRIEPISGEPGQPGSIYRMVPKRGWTFVATVVSRSLPTEVKLSLDAPQVKVSIKDRFLRLSEHRTKLISEEVFTFKGTVSTVIGFLGRGRIKSAHRRHMQSFKRFAEGRAL